MKRFAAILLTAFCSLTNLRAQTDSLPPLRPVSAAYTAGIGAAGIADTYLSPQTYSGWETSLIYNRWQAMRFNPGRWTMQLGGTLDVSQAENKANSNTTWYLDLNLHWCMMHRWTLPAGFTLMAGGATSLSGGVIYNQANGNNPASAKAAWTVNATGMAVWRHTFDRLPVTVSYQPTLPLAGVFFSPDYDELYYEIYLGNHHRLVHSADPFTRFDLTNEVNVDLHFGATALRIGYRGRIFSSRVNHLVTNITTNQFVIGISGEWLSFDRYRISSSTPKIISAY